MASPAGRRGSGAIAVTLLLLLLLPAPASSQAKAVVGAIVRSPFMRQIGGILIKEVATAGASALKKSLRSSNKLGGQLGGDAADNAGIIIYNVSIGQQTFPGMVDIFNDFLWVQCPPSPAQAFSPVPCASETCSNALNTTNDCVDTTRGCLYDYGSADEDTYSTGYLADESFTVGVGAPISGSVVFGCSTNNTVKLDAAIGFSKGRLSILSQLRISRFSYFLTPDDSNSSGSTSAVLLGDQAVPQTKHSRSTPLLQSKVYPDLYYVKLTGIQVDGESLTGIPAGAFDLVADGSSGGVSLSTTTPVTWLQRDAYYAVKQALMSKIKSEPEKNVQGQLDLCYNTNAVAKLKFPKITLVFDDAAMDLTTVHYFYKDNNTNQQCLTMLPMPPNYTLGSILGSMLQAGTNMIYDLDGRQLTFETAAAVVAATVTSQVAIVSMLLAWVLIF